jgi:hypothetical protein
MAVVVAGFSIVVAALYVQATTMRQQVISWY